MTELILKQRGLYAVHDSGAPDDGNGYLTLVMLHGFVWHSGIFKRMLPFAQKYNARVILVNRRDYPGSSPTTENELKQLASTIPASPGAADILRGIVKDHAKELYDLLKTLIEVDHLPKNGGIVVGAWSLGAHFSSALLAHAAQFAAGEIDVASYIRFVVHLDMPSQILGYAPKEGCWNPLFDQSLPPGEGVKIFSRWVSGYFTHGETVAELAPREFAQDIPPTLDTMTPEDLRSTLCVAAGLPGAPEDLFINSLLLNNLCSEVRRAAIFPSDIDSAWGRVKVRQIFGDRSSWSPIWGAESLKQEIISAEKQGLPVRSVEFVRLRGANHFAVWDQPERTLRVLLGGDT